MIEVEEILKKVREVAKIKKDHESDYRHKHHESRIHKYPNYYFGYREACLDYDTIQPHAVKGVFPHELFNHRAPNETEAEHDHAKKNFRQVTMPVFIDHVNSIKRAFNDGNWSISYGKEPYDLEELTFQKYVESDIRPFGSIENWIKQILPPIKSQDPCGVVAVRPAHLSRTESGMIDDSVLPAPVPFYFTIKQVVGYKEDEWFLIESMDHSKLDGRTPGLVYEFYDDTNIWVIRQVGKVADLTFEAELFFTHESGFVPVHRLMGVPVVHGDRLYFQSPFLYATDNLDLVLLNASRLQLSTDKCVYPVRVMLGNECQFVDRDGERCVDGVIQKTVDEKLISAACPSCHGSGLKSRISPLGDFLIRPKSGSLADDNITPDQALKYSSPDVTTLEFLMKLIADNEHRARKILHLQTSNSEVKGTDSTATGMAIDQKALYSYIKPISDEMFYLYEFILRCIGVQRYGKDFKAPSITYPVSFEFFTERDYLEQIKEATQAGLPPFVIHSIIYRFLKSLYYTEKETSRAYELVIRADRLLTLNDDVIALMIGRNTAAKWEEILHVSAISMIQKLESEDPKFWDKTAEERVTVLQAAAKALEAEIKPTIQAAPPLLPS